MENILLGRVDFDCCEVELYYISTLSFNSVCSKVNGGFVYT